MPTDDPRVKRFWLLWPRIIKSLELICLVGEDSDQDVAKAELTEFTAGDGDASEFFGELLRSVTGSEVAASAVKRLEESFSALHWSHADVSGNPEGPPDKNFFACQRIASQLRRLLRDEQLNFRGARSNVVLMARERLMVWCREFGENGQRKWFAVGEDSFVSEEITDRDRYGNGSEYVFVRWGKRSKKPGMWFRISDINDDCPELEVTSVEEAVKDLLKWGLPIPDDLVEEYGDNNFDPSRSLLERERRLGRPSFNSETGHVHFLGKSVADFKPQATSARLVLAKFEDEDWPSEVEMNMEDKAARSAKKTLNELNGGGLRFGDLFTFDVTPISDKKCRFSWSLLLTGTMEVAAAIEELHNGRQDRSSDSYYYADTGGEFPDDEVPF